MEMPFDVLNHRLGKLRDSGLLDGDNTAIAIDIDQDLQRQFIFIPQEEIDAVEILPLKNNLHSSLQAGSGPETIRANEHDNPAWLYNSAVHALAMYQHLQKLEKEREVIAKRPAPGVYQGVVRDGDDLEYFVVIVDVQRRMWVHQGESGGLKDHATMYDSDRQYWTLQRIDVADGTIADG